MQLIAENALFCFFILLFNDLEKLLKKCSLEKNLRQTSSYDINLFMQIIPVKRNGTFGTGFCYRIGFLMQASGMALLAILYPMQNPFFSVGIMLFETGVLFSAICLNASVPSKVIILFMVVSGILLQLSGFFIYEEYAGFVILTGIGILCLGASGLIGREAFRTHRMESWFLATGLSLIAFANIFLKINFIFNVMSFSVLFLLLLFFTGQIFKSSDYAHPQHCT